MFIVNASRYLVSCQRFTVTRKCKINECVTLSHTDHKEDKLA